VPAKVPVVPAKEPISVVVASLPEGFQSLPLGVPIVAPAKPESPSAPEPKVSAPAEASKPDDRLTIRAEELFRKGDVSGARLLLERALGGGNARAAFVLAETFDPNVLSKLGVVGIRGDNAKAREFYARARAMGIAQAGERLEALK
jgi:TPR repeat protein